MRIDRAVTPAGLIARSRSFTLIASEEGLFILHTGNAMREVRTRGVDGLLASALLSKMSQKLDAQLRASESRIDASCLEELAAGRHSAFIPVGSIEALEVKKASYLGRFFPVAVIRAGRKYRFHFPEADEAKVRALFAELQRGRVSVR